MLKYIQLVLVIDRTPPVLREALTMIEIIYKAVRHKQNRFRSGLYFTEKISQCFAIVP